MRLAQEMKLDAPDVSMRYVPEPVYNIEQFDLKQHGTQSSHQY